MTEHDRTIGRGVRLTPMSLDQLMPMHVLVDRAGVITHAGPTIKKIMPGQMLVGQSFFDVFAPRRPNHTRDLEEICFLSGAKFTLRLRDEEETPLTATAACVEGIGGVIINLSFGIAVLEVVKRFNLAGSDFAATDLTLELLYLVEANAAAMAESRMLNERLNGARIEAETEALTDTLTGLYNRRGFDAMAMRLIVRERPFALMHLDLDYFKQVNDTLGHAAGDLVLRDVARILREETRSNDILSRVGGDEFVLVFEGMTDRTQLGALAERLIRRLEEPVPYGDQTARISASIGIALALRGMNPEMDRLMHQADMALYQSKETGRGRFTFHDETQEGRSG